MIDANELVAAIKRIRRGREGKPLQLMVPSAVPAELVDVLAQLDVKVVVNKWLVNELAVLMDADSRSYWEIRPEPKFTELPAYEPRFSCDWKWRM